jgi:quercetin dioxygenase-like cupin family protein
MNEPQGSCEIQGGPAAPGGSGSRVLRLGADFRWQGVPAVEYKQSAEHHQGVTRISLAGEQGESTAFHTRYFEIAPGGFSSREKHVHEHVVVVLRGEGEVRLGEAIHPLAFGDTVYVAPEEVHQFRNRSATEPFGFLCIVDARRDRPTLVTD